MIIAVIVAAAVLVAVCAALLVARHRTFGVSLPRVRGRLGFPGLLVEVTVGRDRWGIPHVIATSMEDAAFDLVITLSPEAHHKAMELTRTSAALVEYWPTQDPTLVEGSREQMLDAYRACRDGLEDRIAARFAVARGAE